MEGHLATRVMRNDAAAFERLLVEVARIVQRREVSVDARLVDVFNINRTLKFIDAVWQASGIELDVNSFYLWPTLRDLAGAMADGSCRNVPKRIRIREGSSPEVLIVFAGRASCFLEMKDFVNALAFDGTVYGMALTPFGRPAATPAVIADEVAACLAEFDASGIARMKGLYRPSRYEGPLVFYRTEGGSPVDCDPRLIWEGHLPAAEWVDVSGNHQTIMIGRHARALAADVSRRLAATLQA